MSNLREFPILFSHDRRREALVMRGCPESVRWDFVMPHERQARSNHDQSLQRLAERGGLDVQELVAVVRGERWNERKFTEDLTAIAELDRLLKEFVAGIVGDVGRAAIETYEVKRVWALFTGCEGDDPTLFGIFTDEDIARRLIELRDKDEDAVCFDPMVVPAVIVGGELFTVNDFRVDTHEEVEAVLKAHRAALEVENA